MANQSFSSSRSALYLVVIRESNGDCFKLWCENITAVRKALTLNLGVWRKSERENPSWAGHRISVLCSCGNTPANLPADAVKAASKRCGRYTVALRTNGQHTTYLEVISLK